VYVLFDDFLKKNHREFLTEFSFFKNVFAKWLQKNFTEWIPQSCCLRHGMHDALSIGDLQLGWKYLGEY
jgi:hypothetical protein